MKKTRIILVAVILLILAFVVYSKFIKKEKVEYSLAEVSRGNVIQTVSETGAVKKGEEINLGFKAVGEIEKIYIAVGDKVKSGDVLAKLNATQLNIQLAQARASLEVSQAQYNKLLAGATPEEIKISQTAVDNAQTSLQSAIQTLEDIKISTEESLSNAYEDSLIILEDSYLKVYNALILVKSIESTYFTKTDQQGLLVKENRVNIENYSIQLKNYLDTAKNSGAGGPVDNSLSGVKIILNSTYQSLSDIRQVCEDSLYRELVSATNKASLDTQKLNISTVLTSVISAQQAISSVKTANNSSINTAESQVSLAEGSLKTAQNQFSKLTAPARKEDVDLYSAQTRQSQAQVNLLQSQIGDTALKSPTDGVITRVLGKEGELTQSLGTNPLISLLPDIVYQIEVDVYEEDIVKMKSGNEANISLIAFPERIFEGRIISLDPAAKIKEGVVYYKVVIEFKGEIPDGVKPDMTADLIIKADSRENVLVVPTEAIQKKNGKIIVEVLENNLIEEKEVKIGLEGTNDFIEIISGIEEGEKIVIR